MAYYYRVSKDIEAGLDSDPALSQIEWGIYKSEERLWLTLDVDGDYVLRNAEQFNELRRKTFNATDVPYVGLYDLELVESSYDWSHYTSSYLWRGNFVGFQQVREPMTKAGEIE